MLPIYFRTFITFVFVPLLSPPLSMICFECIFGSIVWAWTKIVIMPESELKTRLTRTNKQKNVNYEKKLYFP